MRARACRYPSRLKQFFVCLVLPTTQAAMVLGKYMQELKVWAQGEIEAATSQKARFLTGGSESSLGENSREARVGTCKRLHLGRRQPVLTDGLSK